jgi:DNA-directed RNA polymerase subunit RPC12/RpoP
MKLKCNRCENEWEYNGTNPYMATCTRCLRKVIIKKENN